MKLGIRVICLLLCAAMLPGMMPVTAFAEEIRSAETEPVEEILAVAEVTAEETEPALLEVAEETAPALNAVAEPELFVTLSAKDAADETVEEKTENLVTEEVVAPALDADAPTSGTYGENFSWKLENGTLTVSGSGDMPDYSPWNASRDLITTAVIGNGITSVGGSAFYGHTNLTGVTLPGTITKIGPSAFSACKSLERITIPAGVTTIGSSAFTYCSSLTTVKLSTGLVAIEAYAFQGCSKLTDITIPDTVTTLGYAGFYGCKALKTITLPASVTELGDGVFYLCESLEEVNFQAKVALIPRHAFQYCESLKAIKVPEGVTTIETNAFAACSALADVQLPNTLTTLGNDVFTYCASLVSISLPDSITTMDSGMFSYCGNLTTVKLPKYMEAVEGYCFASCSKLKSVIFPENVKTIKEDAFSACDGLNQIDLPDSITSIERGAFWYCDHLTSVDLPANLETIAYTVFAHCISLETVHFPAKVSSIDPQVFAMCTSLTSITVDPVNPNYCNDASGVLYNKGKTILITYPYGREGDFVIPASVTAIGDYAFDRSKVGNVTIPDTATSIGEFAFYNCKNMTRVVLPSSLSTIGSHAFDYASIGGTLEIPGTLTVIEDNAFARTQIENLVIGEGVTAVGASAFSTCRKLTEIQLPSTLTRIESVGFTSIPITRVVIPASVNFLGIGAFSGCYALKDAYFRGNVPEMEGKVFGDSGWQTSTDVTTVFYNVLYRDSWNEATKAEIKKNNPGIKDFCSYLEYNENYSAWGDCGENMKWALHKDGTFTVFTYKEGTDYLESTMSAFPQGEAPWKKYAEHIKCIRVTDGVLNISDHAFDGCAKAKTVSIAPTVETIGINAFTGCEALTSLEIPEGVKTVGAAAFAACSNLATLTISSTVSQLGNQFVSGCAKLSKIQVHQDNNYYSTDLEGVLFNKDQSTLILIPPMMKGIYYVPATVKRVEPNAFSQAVKLQEVAFEGSAPNIAANAFKGATLKAYYPALDTSWTNDVRQSYGGEITWIAYDNTLDFGADVKLFDRLTNLSIFIRPKESRAIANGSPVMRDLKGVTMSSIREDETLGEDKYGFTISQPEAAQQDIVLKKAAYRDYVIPKAVSASIAAASGTIASTYTLEPFMKKLTSGNPYVSSVFGRETKQSNAYIDLVTQELNLEEGTKHDFIMTVVGAEGQSVQYIIGQDSGHMISNYSGVFSSQNLYSKLDFDKKVYAYAIIGNKISTDPVELKIKKMQPVSEATKNFLKSTSFNLLGKDGNIIEVPEEFPLVGGGKLSLEAFKFPLGIKKSGGTLKISLGIDFFEHKYAEEYEDDGWEKKAWNDYKKELWGFNQMENSWSEDISKGMKDLDIYRTFKEKYSDDILGYYDRKINFNVDFIGYIEAKLVDGEYVITDIFLSVGGVFTFRYTIQGAVWVIPVYGYVEAGASLRAATQWARLVPDSDIPMDFALKLSLEPQLRLGIGVGVNGVASGGIFGEAKLPYDHNFWDKYHILKVSGEVGAEGELFVLKGDISLLSGELTVFESYYGGEEVATNALLYGAPADEADSSVSVISREYSADTSPWLGSTAAVAPYAIQAAGTTFHTLQQSVFANSQPQIAALGDGLIMVWVQDDTTRDEYNRMRLVYSIYDSKTSTWSDPQPVCDDGHNDGYPDLVSDGTNAYVVWQKIDITLTEENLEDGVDVLLKNSEIFCAKYDGATGKFGDSEKLTNNDLYDYAPAVAIDSNDRVVYYASVAPDQIGTAKAHTLYRHTNKPNAKASKSNYILSITAENGSAAYVSDGDGDLSTTNDIKVTTIGSWSNSVFNKNENEVAYTYSAFATFKGSNTLFVSDMSNIYYRANYATHAVFDTYRSMNNINILDGANGPVILWTETVNNADELFMVSYTGSDWTQPVQVSHQGKVLRSVNAAMLDGKIVGVCNTDSAQGTTNLEFFQVKDFNDLQVINYIYFDETAAVPGQDQSFNLTLQNKGTSAIEKVTFTITDTLGTTSTVTETVDLAVGCAGSVTLNYPVPQNYSGTVLTVEAAITGKTDADTSNNKATTAIGKPDLAIWEQSTYTVDGGYVVNVNVENAGFVSAKNVNLELMLNEKTEEAAFTQKVGDLDRETYANIDVGIPTSELIFDSEGIARVYLTVNGDSEDAADADNTLCLIFEKPQEGKCAHPATRSVGGKDATCSDAGYTPRVECASCGTEITPSEPIFSKGHDMGNWVTEKDPTCTADGSKYRKCKRTGCDHKETATIKTDGHSYGSYVTDPTCTEKGFTTYICHCGYSYEGAYTDALKHNYVGGVCSRCGTAENNPGNPNPDPNPEAPKMEGIVRLAGANRLVTSYLVADMLKVRMGVEKFDVVIVASGSTFADALPGSYLSAVANAPILLTLNKDKYIAETQDYIKENLVEGGLVFILGGTSAVSAKMEQGLRGFNVVRVAGADRFGTNLEILQAAGVSSGAEILVCEGKGYADSLSASATGKPILLVYKKLTDAQKAYLSTLRNCSFIIVGGTSAVPEKLAQEISAYGSVTRLAGKDRLETSTMVAQRYFGAAENAVVAYGWDFPDGLCGGSLAYAMRAPLILTHSKEKLYKFTADYTTRAGITDGFVLGGDGLVSDAATRAIFGMTGDEQIRVLE